MLPYLNNAQSKRLQEVLQSAFVNYEITENTGNMKESERDFLEIFLAAKRIEGCSEKSLRYYKATIEAMLATLDKNVEYIVTDDIREYLTQYQQKNDLSKVTIDNIRRILSSFLHKRLVNIYTSHKAYKIIIFAHERSLLRSYTVPDLIPTTVGRNM